MQQELGKISVAETALLKGALDFNNASVISIMTPLEQVFMLDVCDSTTMTMTYSWTA